MIPTPDITDEARTILVTEETLWVWIVDDQGSTCELRVFPGEIVRLPAEDDLPGELPSVFARANLEPLTQTRIAKLDPVTPDPAIPTHVSAGRTPLDPYNPILLDDDNGDSDAHVWGIQ